MASEHMNCVQKITDSIEMNWDKINLSTENRGEQTLLIQRINNSGGTINNLDVANTVSSSELFKRRSET